MWFVWKETNDVVFEEQRAYPWKVCWQVSGNMVDYGKLAWERTSSKCSVASGYKKMKSIQDFRRTWCQNGVIAKWVVDQPAWQLLTLNSSYC